MIKRTGENLTFQIEGKKLLPNGPYKKYFSRALGWNSSHK